MLVLVGLLRGEGDLDVLKTLGPLGIRLPRVGLLVGAGELHGVGEGGEEGARVEMHGFHDVDLDAEDDTDCCQVEPGDQTQDDREDTVGGAGVLDDVADVGRPQLLQELPENGGEHRAGMMLR